MGIGFFGLLTLLFIALKLTHVVAWSWLWVLAPIWLPTALWMAFVMFLAAIGFAVALAGGRIGKLR
jgi:hypothetical protein